jgi:hypothetical protein
MKRRHITSKRGFIGLVILFIAALLALAYFGIDVRKLAESELFQKNWIFVRDGAISLWQSYLKGWFVFVYENFLRPLLK